jgi:hypothetical protein
MQSVEFHYYSLILKIAHRGDGIPGRLIRSDLDEVNKEPINS